LIRRTDLIGGLVNGTDLIEGAKRSDWKGAKVLVVSDIGEAERICEKKH